MQQMLPMMHQEKKSTKILSTPVTLQWFITWN